jgi:hypothetical protein
MCDGTKTLILSRVRVVIRFTVFPKIVTVSNYSTIPNSHTLQFTAARTVSS